MTKERHHHIHPSVISKKWGCGLITTKNTLKGTTQLGIRSAIGPLPRRYHTDLLQLHYRCLNTTFYTDTMLAKTKSIKGNTCSQIYTGGQGFITSYTMKSKEIAEDTLSDLFTDVGIPKKIIYDGTPEQVGWHTKFQQLIRKNRIEGYHNEPYTQKYNRAENSVRELKRRWKQRIIKRRAPKRVWYLGIVWEEKISSSLCRHGSTTSGIDRITGDTPGISEWLEFEFYDLCWYWDTPYSEGNSKLGRWLSVSHRVGMAMCYWILTSTGRTIFITTVLYLNEDEVRN